MNKTIVILMTSLFAVTSSFAADIEGSRFLQSEEAVKLATYGHLDARALKALLDSNTPLTLLDARGDKWHDGHIIPGAKLASYEYTEEALKQAAPYRDGLVIVYCYSFTCPLSGRLADKLVQLGYSHVIEYPAGLKEWRDVANYPVEPIEKAADKE